MGFLNNGIECINGLRLQLNVALGIGKIFNNLVLAHVEPWLILEEREEGCFNNLVNEDALMN